MNIFSLAVAFEGVKINLGGLVDSISVFFPIDNVCDGNSNLKGFSTFVGNSNFLAVNVIFCESSDVVDCLKLSNLRADGEPKLIGAAVSVDVFMPKLIELEPDNTDELSRFDAEDMFNEEAAVKDLA